MPARMMIGTVVSDTNAKTVMVRVDHARRHPLYSKAYTVTRKFAVHDENNEAHLGDKVQIQDGRPISKTKSWRLVKVLERAQGTVIDIDESEVEAVLSTKSPKTDMAEPVKTSAKAADKSAKKKPAPTKKTTEAAS